MTDIMRFVGASPVHESRRKRTLACALERRAAGTVPVVRNPVVILGVALLLVALADLVLMVGVLI